MGLLLFGLAFLFKYSIEQGWLGPAVRVGFGALTGGALLAAGLRLYDERPRLRQVLLGGSSATFYGTVFAAYQLYGLVSYPVAFGAMVTITLLTIGLALQQDVASLAVIGTAGGLGTPFLLYCTAFEQQSAVCRPLSNGKQHVGRNLGHVSSIQHGSGMCPSSLQHRYAKFIRTPGVILLY
jgi:hypothetical protein